MSKRFSLKGLFTESSVKPQTIIVWNVKDGSVEHCGLIDNAYYSVFIVSKKTSAAKYILNGKWEGSVENIYDEH